MTKLIPQLKQKSRVLHNEKTIMNDLFPNKFQEPHLNLNM